MSTFKDLEILPEIQRALDELSITEPTEIQKKSIPLLLSSKKIDFHGQAQTGTGKTFAFAIPLLSRIDLEKRVPQALVVAPTRELAVQIYESMMQIAKYMPVKIAVIYGGVSMEAQMDALRRGAHIIVGTPGRLNDHLKRKTLSLKDLKTLVLDEADIMLDMGFKEEIDTILEHTPKGREIWLFSATVKGGIDNIKRTHMVDPVVVRVSLKQVGSAQTKQYYCIVPFRNRLHGVVRFIQVANDFYGIIFCQTKILASEVADELTRRGYNVGALHGDLSQAHRNMIIKKFKQKDITVLVATDVAARGIDVANLSHVINYSLPEDLESYVHRVGRTGRAGKEGIAITFISRSEVRFINQIEKRFGVSISQIDVPSEDKMIEKALEQVKDYIGAIKEAPIGLEQLKGLIDGLTIDELRHVSQHLLYDKFIAPLDFEEIPVAAPTASVDDDNIQEIFINVGLDDGVTPDAVRKYILDTKAVTIDQIQKIRVIKRRTFVKLAADCTPELLLALKDKPLDGRKVRVNMTCLVNDSGNFSRPQQRDGGGRRDGGRDGGRDRRDGGGGSRRRTYKK